MRVEAQEADTPMTVPDANTVIGSSRLEKHLYASLRMSAEMGTEALSSADEHPSETDWRHGGGSSGGFMQRRLTQTSISSIILRSTLRSGRKSCDAMEIMRRHGARTGRQALPDDTRRAIVMDMVLVEVERHLVFNPLTDTTIIRTSRRQSGILSSRCATSQTHWRSTTCSIQPAKSTKDDGKRFIP